MPKFSVTYEVRFAQDFEAPTETEALEVGRALMPALERFSGNWYTEVVTDLEAEELTLPEEET